MLFTPLSHVKSSLLRPPGALMNPQVISQAADLHRYLSVMDWLAFSDTQNMRSHQAVTYSCLGEGREKSFMFLY